MPALQGHAVEPHRRAPAIMLAALVALQLLSASAQAEPPLAVSPQGQWLARFLDKLDVEHHWLRSRERVSWATGAVRREMKGKVLPPLPNEETHCSAFAAAAAKKLGVKLLGPPEHSTVLLANAQYDWLAGEAGRAAGWSPTDSPLAAQQAANRGKLVMAVCKNPDMTEPGHIAIVRPSKKSADKIAKTGPQVTQAGFRNFRAIDLKTGFMHHPEAWPTEGKPPGVKFYAHEIAADKIGG